MLLENAGSFRLENLFFSRRCRPSIRHRADGELGPWWSVVSTVIERQATRWPSPTRCAESRGSRVFESVTWDINLLPGMVTSRDFGPSSNRVFAADLAEPEPALGVYRAIAAAS